ncbi:hypothetical protein ASC80_12920 [Afipia sp. Root123D2]|uniref:DUF4238 domain-containing protein n=1 Tax=Afipia sp. Root123D2 TaxID=1736436 RepID=UPI0007013CF6|nr:DUF4238 domain-containing protein [Afipia sp. Root123D2]KQW21043.1 hypothetical protein ASC80_12920 [Afipia sp. Root123D2]
MGKTRNRPVKQHYVPQCYLRQFANKKGNAHQISVFDRKLEKSFKNNVKDVGCQNYFNRIYLDGMDPDALESAMGDFETGLAEALVRINEARNLENEDDRSYLLTLIGLTALRNPDMRKNIRGIADGLGRMHIAARLQSQATYDASVAEAKVEGALPENYDVTFEEMRTAFEGGSFKIALDSNAVISVELQLLDHTIPLLHKRGWHLLRAPEGSGGFITSDRPFYLYWQDPAIRNGPMAPGLAMMGTDIYFPISPTLAVVGAFNVGNTVEDATEETVAVCNSTMPDGADRQVYSADHKFKYVRTREETPRTGGQLISDKRFLRKI